MKKLLAIVAALAVAYVANDYFADAPAGTGMPAAQEVATTTRLQSGGQVSGSGTVTRILSDDDRGDRHQRFIIRLPSGQTLLVAHNIDLAPRVAPLAVGDVVEFSGEYASNDKGGVVHWTHHDPAGRHPGGWLKRGARTFE